MAVKAVIGFIIGLFVLGIIGGFALIAANTARGRKARPGVLLLVAGIIGVVVLAPLNAGLWLIQPSQIGVVFRQTGSGDAALLTPIQPGLKWVIPFVDQVIIYNAGQQNIDMVGSAEAAQVTNPHPAVTGITNDGQQITLDVTVIFRIDPTEVNRIHRSWPSTVNDPVYIDGFVIPQTRSVVRDAVSNYSAEEIYSGGRATLENQIKDKLTPVLAQEGFLLTAILIRDISFTAEFANAIEQKQIAEQQAQQAAFRVQQAEQEAEQARVEAKGLADAVVIAAQGEADAIRLRGQAESDALRLINEILAQNPQLIQYVYINSLGEKVRLIIIPSNSPFLFDLESLLGQAGVTPTTPEPVPTPEPTPTP